MNNSQDRNFLPEGNEKVNELVSKLLDATKFAGDKILQIYNAGYLVEHKNNDSYDPLTEADKASDVYLREVVRNLFPNDEILSEENDAKDLNYSGSVWMIDPLDGTKDFMKGGSRFSVMIGRCEKGIPTLGIVYLPIGNIWYYAVKGLGAYRKEGNTIKKIKVSDINQINGAKFFGKSQFSEPRPIEDAMKISLGINTFLTGGSIGIILGEIAEGKGDAYLFTNPRAGKWDVCALQIILQEAGGSITDADGNPLDFAGTGYKLKNYFIASNGNLHDTITNVSKNIYRSI